jgi:hypothetical protein
MAYATLSELQNSPARPAVQLLTFIWTLDRLTTHRATLAPNSSKFIDFCMSIKTCHFISLCKHRLTRKVGGHKQRSWPLPDAGRELSAAHQNRKTHRLLVGTDGLREKACRPCAAHLARCRWACKKPSCRAPLMVTGARLRSRCRTRSAGSRRPAKWRPACKWCR